MARFADRVAAEAVDVRPLHALLTALAFVFYVLGLLIGAVIVAVSWSVAAVRFGIADVRARANGGVDAESPTAPAEAD